MNTYEKKLLDALRLVTCEKNDNAVLTNENIVKAVTVNEELKNLGYTLNPTDLINLAKSPSLDTFYDKVKEMVPEINVSPMYPDFPTQVMEMDEATFRFHQMVHYFSTYGMESLFGVSVDKGWLPDVEETEKTEKDTKLLESKVIELVSKKQMYTKPMSVILSKRERMTALESEIITEAVPNVSSDFLGSLKIPFKENMESLFMHIAENMDKDEALKNLHALCQHTGDVLRFTEKYLNNHKFHLKTSEKRLFVKLLESYPSSDLRANLVHSAKGARRNLAILQHLDYNKYSRSASHKEAVNDLRNDKIRSWEARARKMIAEHNPEAVSFVGQRPGMALRMVSLLVREGYDAQSIADMLKENAGALSTQTLVSAYFTSRRESINGVNPKYRSKPEMSGYQMQVLENSKNDKKEYIIKQQEYIARQNEKNANREDKRVERKTNALESVNAILKRTIEKKFEIVDTPLRNTKVYIKDDGIDLNMTEANPASKSMQGGYVPSTVSYKIPDSAKYIRVYVYWNDKERVDVDLHAIAIDKDGNYKHIGWNGDYNNSGIIHSGDITHSDAAEYIDIDLSGNVKYAGLSFDVYSGQPAFKDVDTCFAGIMAVDHIGKEVKLYSPENSFFTHDINCDSRGYKYGYIDVENKTLKFIGETCKRGDIYMPPVYHGEIPFSMKEYLDIVIKGQDAQVVDTPEEADIVLTMCKPENEKELSLIDSNFFYDSVEKVVSETERTRDEEVRDVDVDSDINDPNVAETMEKLFELNESLDSNLNHDKNNLVFEEYER